MLINQFDRSIYVVGCHQRTVTHLIYKMRSLSNLPSNNFIRSSTENYQQYQSTEGRSTKNKENNENN